MKLLHSFVFLICLLIAHAGYADVGQTLDEDEAGLWMLSDRHEQHVRTSSRIIKDSALSGYLTDLTCRVVSDVCKNIRVYPVRAPGFNAFMMPNGGMVVQSGLLLRVHDEAELAAVLGHEASHFVREHQLNQIRKYHKTASVFAVVGAVVSAAGTLAVNSASSYEQSARAANLSDTAILMLQTAGIVATFQLVAYGREHETEADVNGLDWLHASGFDPTGAARIWQRLVVEQNAGKGNSGFSLLATHPAPEKRLEYLRDRATEMNPGSSDSTSLLNVIEPYRDDWLNDELHIQHPDQFAAIVTDQMSLGLTEGFGHYLVAKSWLRHAKQQNLRSKKKMKAFYEQANTAFQKSKTSESGLPADGYRDWGKLCVLLDLPTDAKQHFAKYLELRPDAWDARFVSKEMQAL